MTDHCQIPRSIEKIFSASHCSTAYLGGSLTVGVGASDTSRKSFRALFTAYLYEKYHPVYHNQVSEIMGAVGACESYVAAFTLGRNILPANPDLALVEFCVNDFNVPDRTLVLKGMEGIVRQLLSARCDVMILGAGSREGNIDHSAHRQIAEHYDLPFVDMQAHIFARLKERNLSWDDVALEFEINDPWHVNDLGNFFYFEAIRDEFEKQVELFRAGRKRERNAPLPPPIVSDELQHVRLIDPTVRNRNLSLAGKWDPKPAEFVPWYFDHVLMGRPGATMTLNFKGTAAAVFGLMYHNGLKLEAELDGKEIPGFYIRHFIEFGKGLVMAHGLPDGEHELKLTVGVPSHRHNKLADPAAQVAFLGVASKAETPQQA